MKIPSLTTHHLSVNLPPPLFRFLCSVIITEIIIRALSPQCDGEEGHPPTWLW